jgi:hypothetical protein
MGFIKDWKEILTGHKNPAQDSTPGHELWEEILASVPPQFIPLVCCEGCVENDRVCLSNGTICLQRPESNKAEYSEGAFLPRTPWRKPTDWERKRLWQELWDNERGLRGSCPHSE